VRWTPRTEIAIKTATALAAEASNRS